MLRNIEERKQNRMKLMGYLADISDGYSNYDAIVEDVSFDGLCLSDLSNKFVVKNKIYHLVISGGSDAVSYKLKVHPRWTRKHGNFIEVGFNVIRAPSKWKKFVRQVMPNKKYDDVEENWEQNSLSKF